jgi:DNA-binding transcriptional MerR regulator
MTRSGRVRIDTAAQLTGLTTRSIRAYQSQGLLPAPGLEGRVGFYDTRHLDRLRAIRRLQEQGFSLAGIKRLLDAHDRGLSLDAVLGLEPAPRPVGEASGPTPRPLRLALVPEPLVAAVGGTDAGPAAG